MLPIGVSSPYSPEVIFLKYHFIAMVAITDFLLIIGRIKILLDDPVKNGVKLRKLDDHGTGRAKFYYVSPDQDPIGHPGRIITDARIKIWSGET